MQDVENGHALACVGEARLLAIAHTPSCRHSAGGFRVPATGNKTPLVPATGEPRRTGALPPRPRVATYSAVRGRRVHWCCR